MIVFFQIYNKILLCMLVIWIGLLEIVHNDQSDQIQNSSRIKPFCNGSFYDETKYCGIGILSNNNASCIAWKYYSTGKREPFVQNTTLCELDADHNYVCATSNFNRNTCKKIGCTLTKSTHKICDAEIFWSSASSSIQLDFSRIQKKYDLIILLSGTNSSCFIAKVCVNCSSADRLIGHHFSSCASVPASFNNSDVIEYTNLTPSTENIFYLMPVINSFSIGTVSRLALVIKMAAPRVPTGISINILVNWNKNEESKIFGPAEKYEIEIRNSSSKEIDKTYSVHTNSLLVTDSQTGKQNCFSVIAVNSAGRSRKSEEHCTSIKQWQTENVSKLEKSGSEYQKKLVFVIYGLLLLLIVVFASILFWCIMKRKRSSKMLTSKVANGVSIESVNSYEMSPYSKCNNPPGVIIGEFMNLSIETLKMERQSQLTTVIGNLPENLNKNRCPGIVPYDDARVMLEDKIYINASNIPFVNDANQTEFIACQSPVAENIHDFWTMIWENNISTIVMLSRINERRRNKCLQYWPSNTKNREYYGRDLRILVLLDQESHNDEFVERIFRITHEITKEERLISQLQLISWKSSHAPNVNNFEHLVNRFNEMTSSTNGGPYLVHCSNGVGRSGVFIVAIRLTRKRMNEGKEIDICREVMDLRKYNGHMVLRQNQYIFLHALVESLSKKEFLKKAELCNRIETEPVYGTVFD